jgi:O-antigen ligase
MNIVYSFLIGAIAILLPWGRSINSISIVLLAIVWLFSFDWKSKWSNLIKYKFELLPFLAYFFIHIIVLSYSKNFNAGIEEIIKKLSFFILPIVIFSVADEIAPYIDKIKQSFIWSLFFYFIVSLITAYSYYLDGNKLAFYYIHLISYTKMHPSYISIFLIIGIAFAYNLGLNGKKLYYLFIPIFIIFVLLLSARTEILILGIVLIIICLYHFKRIEKPVIGYLLVLLILFASFASIKYIPELNTRFSVLKKGEENSENLVNIKNERNQIWTLAIEQIYKTPISGIGVGASQDFYFSKFKEKKYILLELKKLNNTHNQFLHQFLITGFFGFIICMFFYFYPLYKSLVYKDLISFILNSTFIIASITECILETQSGIVGVVLFSCICLVKNHRYDNSATSYLT